MNLLGRIHHPANRHHCIDGLERRLEQAATALDNLVALWPGYHQFREQLTSYTRMLD